MKLNRQNLGPVWGIACLLFIWELVCQMAFVPRFILPSPVDVFQASLLLRSDLWQSSLATLLTASMGVLIGFCAGFMLAVAFSFFRWSRDLFFPLAVFFQTVPIISIAPLMVIWFGFGMATVVAASAVVCFFPVMANTMLGLQQVSPQKMELFAIYQASPQQIFNRLRLPSAIPAILAGLKISAGLSVVGSLVGEFVAGGGLGQLIDSARTQQRVDLVFACVILSSIIGLILIQVVKLVESAFKKMGFL